MATLVAEKARQSLPAWARLAPAEGVIHRRSCGGERGVGSGGGGARRVDAASEGEGWFMVKAGGGVDRWAPDKTSARKQRRANTSVLSAVVEEDVRFQHLRGLPSTPVSPRKYFSSSPVDAAVFVGPAV